MSSKSTIFLTTANEHCYSDCNEYSRSGENNDITIEVDNEKTVVTPAGLTWVLITLYDEIKEIIGLDVLIVLTKNIKRSDYNDDDGWSFQIDGDSPTAIFLRNLKVDKKYR